MHIKTLFCGLALSAIGLSARPSEAAVTQITLRTEAQVCVGADAVNLAGALNGSAATETVICPVVTYSGTGSSFAGSGSVKALVWDRSTSAVTCELWKKDSSGNISQVGAAQATTGTSASSIPLTFNISGGLNSVDGLSVKCTVPANDVVVGPSGVSAIVVTYTAQ